MLLGCAFMPDAISTPMEWNVPFDASEGYERSFKDIWAENGEKLPFKAMIVDTSKNNNGWAVPENELDAIAAQVTQNQLRINHEKKDVRGVVGSFTEAKRKGNSIIAKGFIVDEQVAKLVHSKSVNNISISAKKPDDMLCSACGISTKSKRLCAGAHHILKGVELVEISIVPTGAYPNAKIFSATLDAYITNYEQEFMMDTGRDKKKEAQGMPEDEKDKKKDEEKDAQDDNGMEKEVKALRAENAKLKAQIKNAQEDEENKKKDKEAALEAEKTSLEAENAEIKARLAEQPPVTGESQIPLVEDDGKPKGTFDAMMEELENFMEAQGADLTIWRS